MTTDETPCPRFTSDTEFGKEILLSALEHSPAAMSLTDRDGHILYVNQRFLDTTGYSRDEVIGHKPSILKSGEFQQSAYQELWQTVLAGREWQGVFHNRKKNGELYWERAVISPLLDANGEIAYFIKFGEDIGAQFDLERNLADRNKLIGQITHNMSDVVSILDTKGHYIYVTPSSDRVLGYPPEKLIGKHFTEHIAPDQRIQHEADFAEAATRPRGRIESRFLHGKGHYIWLESAVQPMTNEKGLFAGLVISSRDISRRKQIEEELTRSNKELQSRRDVLNRSLARLKKRTHELRHSEKRYERLVQATHGFIFTVLWNDDRTVGAVNYPGCEAVTGYTPNDYATDPELWSRMVHPDDRAAVMAQIEAIRDGAEKVTIEHRILHKDNTTRWLRNTSVPHHDERGALSGYDGLITDITELKSAEAERDALMEQLREMAVRDPLTHLLNRRGFDEELRRLWSLSQRHAFPIGLLVIDIDHFKTLNDSYGHMVGDQVLQEGAQLIRKTLRDSDVICRFGGDELIIILPWANADETKLVADRILTLFRETVFCAGSHDLHVTISAGVSNMTPGPGRTLERLLSNTDQALYRAKRAGRNRMSFAGDTTETAPTPSSGRAPPLAVESGPQRGSVLVVDDEASIRKLLSNFLTREQFDVKTAESSATAMACLEAEPGLFDVALVDLQLGVDNGIDLLKKIRDFDETIIGVIITGQVTIDSAVASLRSGAYDFLQKPLSIEQLTAVLERATKYRRLMLENQRYQLHLEDMIREKSSALSQALDRVRNAYHFTLEAMAAMLDAREQQTAEHSKRVAQMAKVIAREMNVAPEDIETIEIGALLHDIGKIAIPDAILLKPGPLTPEEQTVMRQHPEIGYNILHSSPLLKEASEIVLSHQEHYDGGGYPRGLKGDQICLGARIFAAADAYDAMRARRPYAEPQSAEDTITEIIRHKGTQFDPVVVEAVQRCQQQIEAIGKWPKAATEATP